MDLKINKIENENLEYCLFCYQEKDLIKNELCQCEFFYDQKCYEKWFINKRHLKCIICQRKIDFKFIHFKNEHNDYLQNLRNNLRNNHIELLIRNRNRTRNNITILNIADVYFEYIFNVIIILFIFVITISLIMVLLSMYVF